MKLEKFIILIRCSLVQTGGAKHQDVEDTQLLWFKQALCLNVPFLGPFYKQKLES